MNKIKINGDRFIEFINYIFIQFELCHLEIRIIKIIKRSATLNNHQQKYIQNILINSKSFKEIAIKIK